MYKVDKYISKAEVFIFLIIGLAITALFISTLI